jgi:hypothetical protein
MRRDIGPKSANKAMQPKVDAKNIKLVELVAQLRDHIDIHRIIGLNGPSSAAVTSAGPSSGTCRGQAQEALAMYLCKIFETSSRNDLNSIPAIIGSLPATTLSGDRQHDFDYRGQVIPHGDPRAVLRDPLRVTQSTQGVPRHHRSPQRRQGGHQVSAVARGVRDSLLLPE